MSVIKTVWQMSGEKEYKQNISEINRGIGVLDSEMKKISSAYKDNASSVEALNSKHDVLERTLLSQKEKVDVLREALKRSAESYGESDKRTMNWQRSLNLAEAQVYETESAIRKNEESLRSAIEATEDATASTDNLTKAEKDNARESMGLGDALDKLAGKFGINLPESMTGTLNGVKMLSPEFVVLGGAVAAAVAVVVDLEKKLLSLTIQSAATADDILTLAQTTSLATDTIQEMQYASGLLDVSFETISGSLTKLTNAMQDARDGNDKLTAIFDSLGVSVTNADGSLRDAESVFYDVIDALGQIQNGTERDAVAMDLFGKSAQDLNPLILQGSAALRELAEEAHDAGYVMSGETLDALGAVDDAYQRLQLTQDSVKNQIAGEFAPAAEKALTDFAKFIKDAGDAFKRTGVVDSMGALLTSATGLLKPIGSLLQVMSGPLSVQLKAISYLVALIADGLNSIVGYVKLVPELFGGTKWKDTTLATALGKGNAPSNRQIVTASWSGNSYNSTTGSWYNGSEINYGNYQNDVSMGLFSGSYSEYMTYKKNQYGWNAGGAQNWRGGGTWVGENGPELVFLPSGSRIMSNQESRSSGGDVFNITIDAKSVQEFNDIVRIAKTARVRERMG